MYSSKALTGQVGKSDLAITSPLLVTELISFDDSRKMEAYVGKNLTSQAFIWLNSLKRTKHKATDLRKLADFKTSNIG